MKIKTIILHGTNLLPTLSSVEKERREMASPLFAIFLKSINQTLEEGSGE
jgi:hypothetical protein